MLPVLCSRGVAAARADGLGAMVAGSVGRSALGVAAGLTALALLVVAWSSRRRPAR